MWWTHFFWYAKSFADFAKFCRLCLNVHICKSKCRNCPKLWYLWFQFSTGIVLHICFPFLLEMWYLCNSIHICKSECRNCPEFWYLWLTFNFQLLFSIFVFLFFQKCDTYVIVVDWKAKLRRLSSFPNTGVQVSTLLSTNFRRAE